MLIEQRGHVRQGRVVEVGQQLQGLCNDLIFTPPAWVLLRVAFFGFLRQGNPPPQGSVLFRDSRVDASLRGQSWVTCRVAASPPPAHTLARIVPANLSVSGRPGRLLLLGQ